MVDPGKPDFEAADSDAHEVVKTGFFSGCEVQIPFFEFDVHLLSLLLHLLI